MVVVDSLLVMLGARVSLVTGRVVMSHVQNTALLGLPCGLNQTLLSYSTDCTVLASARTVLYSSYVLRNIFMYWPRGKTLRLIYKLYGVGPVDNRPSTE